MNKILMYHGFCAVLCAVGCGFFYIVGGGTQPAQAQAQETPDIDVIPDPMVNEGTQEKSKMEMFEEYQRELQRKEAEAKMQNDFNSLSFFQGSSSTEFEDETTESEVSQPTMTKEEEIEALNKIGSDKVAYHNHASASTTSMNTTATETTVPVEEEKPKESVQDRIARKKKEAMANKRKRISEQTGIDITEPEDHQEQTPMATASAPTQGNGNSVKKKSKGFRPMGGGEATVDKSSIRAVIHGEQKDITTASQVRIRLLDNVNVNGLTIPKNTMVYAKASFSSNRIHLNIESITYNSNVYPFDAVIYDLDGFEGLYVPDNAVNEAGKQTTSGVVSGSGVGITTTQRAVTSLITNTTSAIKNATNNKIKETKVTLPSNYKLIIKQKG